MNIKQLFLVTTIQVALTFILFLPQIPDFIQELVHGPEFIDNGVSKVYGIIFKWGIVNMLIFSLVIVGKRTNNELRFILFSEAFLAIIFYQKYDNSSLILTLTFLVLALIILSLRIPLRKIIIANKILSN